MPLAGAKPSEPSIEKPPGAWRRPGTRCHHHHEPTAAVGCRSRQPADAKLFFCTYRP
jgi:hypothetical protein